MVNQSSNYSGPLHKNLLYVHGWFELGCLPFILDNTGTETGMLSMCRMMQVVCSHAVVVGVQKKDVLARAGRGSADFAFCVVKCVVARCGPPDQFFEAS